MAVAMGRKSGYPESRDRLLLLIGSNRLRNGRSPSVRWLADELGVGVATTHSYLSLLAEEGLIEWTPRQHRSIRCTPLGIQQLSSLAPL